MGFYVPGSVLRAVTYIGSVNPHYCPMGWVAVLCSLCRWENWKITCLKPHRYLSGKAKIHI